MLDTAGQWILSRTQVSTEFSTIMAPAKAGIEAWTPQRIARVRVSRHVRRKQEVRSAALSPYIFVFCAAASTARIALGEYFKAKGVYTRGDASGQRRCDISSVRRHPS